MTHGRTLAWGLVLAVLLPLPLALPIRGARAGELAEPAWREAQKEAKSLMKTPGYRFRKEEYVAQVSRDNSERAAKLLVQWSVRSLKYQRGKLGKELAKAHKDHEKALAKKDRDAKSYKRYKAAFDKAREHHEAEDHVQFAIGEGLAAISDTEAIGYLRESGLPALQKERGTETLQVIVARSLLRQSPELVRDTAMALAKDTERPDLCVLGLNWIGRNKEANGFDTLLAAVKQPPVAVQRAAVFALQALDDVRAVEPLIHAMQDADGLLNAEIDHLLHRFTGKSFEASGSVWKMWWEREGAAWLAQADPKRHPPVKTVQKKGGTMVRFYGIPTPSRRVVFVVDRSKSMEAAAGEKSKAKKEPKGPVTGKKAPKDGETVAGDTRMEVAKNQLALSIDELDKDVEFGVIFYSGEVLVWQDPPDLLPASPQNKEAAKAWIKAMTPYGPTLTFGALMQALEFAVITPKGGKGTRAGVDTIFLLSDGNPTTADSRVLAGEELEQAYRAFVARNELYHCVVHTVGIGPGHNWEVLKRLSKDTGGTYKAVGVK